MPARAVLDKHLQGRPQPPPALHDVLLALAAGDNYFARQEAEEYHGGGVRPIDQTRKHVFLVRAVQVQPRVHRV